MLNKIRQFQIVLIFPIQGNIVYIKRWRYHHYPQPKVDFLENILQVFFLNEFYCTNNTFKQELDKSLILIYSSKYSKFLFSSFLYQESTTTLKIRNTELFRDPKTI